LYEGEFWALVGRTVLGIVLILVAFAVAAYANGLNKE